MMDMNLKSGMYIGPYEVLSLIGAGGMGEVYRARDSRLGREVAIKVLQRNEQKESDSGARLEREARAIASLSHPNILSIFDFGSDQEIMYAVMELLQGATLRERLIAGPLPFEECLEYAIQTCRGLQAAHEKGILHRDLKPENLFITADGQVKILDFGLARMTLPDSIPNQTKAATILHTQQGLLLGTFPYMSPEQAEMKEVDARSDLFSLGTVLYESSTGRNPFQGTSPISILGSILKDDPACADDVNPTIPPEWGSILRRCLQKDPFLRYSSAKELRMDLQMLQNTGVTSATRARTIAVLPFTDMSQTKDQDYFCDGMAEEIINALSKLPGLKVSARISSFQFKHQQIDVRGIGKRLGVNTVLEGSVRKSGERLRISVQLIDMSDGYQLWSERYDRELRDVFEIQEEIAQAIVSALSVTLESGNEKALKKKRANPKAYEFYLQAKNYFNRETRKSIEYAVEMFQKSIAIDPQYAPAYADLAAAFGHLYNFWNKTEANLRAAEEASRKALELAPDIAETHIARGYALSLQEQYVQAAVEFETALEIDPRSFDGCYFYARSEWAAGRTDRAAQYFERAAHIRPEDFRTPALLTGLYRSLKKPHLVQQWANRSLRILEPWVAYHPDEARALYFTASAYACLGETEKAIEWGQKAVAVDPEDGATYYNLGCTYANMGRNGEAIDFLEQAIDKGFASRGWIANDGDLLTLHDHPRFQALLQKLRA
jgi:serine/threonine protein kinase